MMATRTRQMAEHGLGRKLQMYAYDQKRYSTSPTVRASAASYGKSLHNNLMRQP